MSAVIALAVWFAATACLMSIFAKRLWRSLSLSLRLYLVAGWALFSIGVLQTISTPLHFSTFGETALWFATSGVAVGLTGALNLLNLGREFKDAGVRRVCRGERVHHRLLCGDRHASGDRGAARSRFRRSHRCGGRCYVAVRQFPICGRTTRQWFQRIASYTKASQLTCGRS